MRGWGHLQKKGGGGICNFPCFQGYKLTQDLAISLRLIVLSFLYMDENILDSAEYV